MSGLPRDERGRRRSLTSHGYVMVRVGKDHHLADGRGWAYEHRLVAEEKLGRKLRPGEEVHHKNGDKQDNSHGNLAVCHSRAHHYALHRTEESDLRLPGEPNPVVECACGCGVEFRKYDDRGRPRRMAQGHPAKLTVDQVREIRARAEGEDITPTALADDYPVCARTVMEILSGKVWSRV